VTYVSLDDLATAASWLEAVDYASYFGRNLHFETLRALLRRFRALRDLRLAGDAAALDAMALRALSIDHRGLRALTLLGVAKDCDLGALAELSPERVVLTGQRLTGTGFGRAISGARDVLLEGQAAEADIGALTAAEVLTLSGCTIGRVTASTLAALPALRDLRSAGAPSSRAHSAYSPPRRRSSGCT
jgi:hypothetical protein